MQDENEMPMVDGYCLHCRKPAGRVSWDAADFVFHRRCWKAREVYTPPPGGRACIGRIFTLRAGR
jgi:hypothetical protein